MKIHIFYQAYDENGQSSATGGTGLLHRQMNKVELMAKCLHLSLFVLKER